MKTKISLIALAILSLGPHAPTQSAVTIYGLIDTAVRHQSNATATGGKTSVEGGLSSGSRIGFRGVEDLGSGLNAHFVLENGFGSDSATAFDANSFFNRTALIGLGDSWGSLDLGRQYSVPFKTTIAYDPLNGKYSGFNVAVSIVPGSPGTGCLPMNAGACARFNNDIQYTGVFGGLTLRAEHSLGEQSGQSHGSATSVAAQYGSGPFSVGGAYTKQKTLQIGPVASLPGYSGSPVGKNHTYYTVGGAYTSGDLRATLGYARDTTETNSADTVFKNIWGGIGFQVTPALALTGAYYQSKLSSAVSATRSDGKEQVDIYVIEARYVLSKRTSVYAEMDKQKWSRGALFIPTNAPGVKQTGISVGVVHVF